MADEPTESPASPDEQPDPRTNDAEITPALKYKRACQRLNNLVHRQAVQDGSIDYLKLAQNHALRSAEINAMSNLLVAKGICTLDELYDAIAISAVSAGNKIFAKVHAPKLVDADGQKLNGS